MYLAIKSEMDSRPFLYPLIRALKSYGSILVISSNQWVYRLIEEEHQGFRNITVIVETTGATDTVYEDYGVGPDDYDFVILDNMGAIDFDYLFILRGKSCSEDFAEEVDLYLTDKTNPNLYIVQYGGGSKGDRSAGDTKRPQRKSQPERPRKGTHSRKGQAVKEQVDAESYDPAEKFREKEENIKQTIQTVSGTYPTFQDIDLLESEHLFPEVPRAMIDPLYTMLKSLVLVDRNQFTKEVRRKDESSGNLRTRSVERR